MHPQHLLPVLRSFPAEAGERAELRRRRTAVEKAATRRPTRLARRLSLRRTDGPRSVAEVHPQTCPTG